MRRYQATFVGLVLTVLLAFSIYQISRSANLLDEPLFAQGQIAEPQTLSTQTQLSETAYINGYELKTMSSGYTIGTGLTPVMNDQTSIILSRLGYTAGDVWKSGVNVVSYNGLVPKRCGGHSGKLGVSGLAVKPDADYTVCSDGRSIIPDEYKHAGKCSIHFNSSAYGDDVTSAANSTAVFAHELGHCLFYIYGEDKGMMADYMAVRTDLEGKTYHEQNEIFADDYMICEHAVDTSFGRGSYYYNFDVEKPTETQCDRLVVLYEKYFPI